ncbi:MAG: hypothetical protein MUO85_02045, partial [candidate division Zixibacteria bacterium]|nr:hypothetical protein [candidate division Zixibacteria bacterium]
EISCGLEKFKNLDSLPVQFIWMSDSILFYTEDNSIEKFKYISNIIAGFIRNTIESGPFLYRGTLSHGDFYFDQKLNLYLGPAMIDVVDWEKKQNWSGVMLTPDCSDFVKKNHYDGLERKISVDRGVDYGLLEFSGPLLVEYDVPLKKGLPSKRSLCLNWTVAARTDFRVSKLGDVLASVESESERKSIEEKVDNTLQFLNYCKQFEKRIEING